MEAVDNRNSRSSISSQSTSDSYPKIASAYELHYLIAESNHGKVYNATVKSSGQPVAFKIIDLDTLKDVGSHSKSDSGAHLLSDVIREITILKKCRHENVVELKTAFVHKSNICLVMELFEGGTLQDILRQPPFHNGLRDEELMACLLRQILKGLKYCHDNDILHRDLKASNVLINKEGVCKLADFAFSGELTEGGEKKRVRHTFVGSTHWMAPEVMAQAGLGYNQSADIWSFGITALELANGKTPTENFSELKIYLQTIEGPSPSLNDELFKNYSKSFKDLVSPCLEKDPKKRPTAEQLLRHSFFNKAKSKGKDYVKEKLMSSVPIKRGEPVSNDDPLGSHHEENTNSLEWDFDRDKYYTERKEQDLDSQTDLGKDLPSINSETESNVNLESETDNQIDLIVFDEDKDKNYEESDTIDSKGGNTIVSSPTEDDTMASFQKDSEFGKLHVDAKKDVSTFDDIDTRSPSVSLGGRMNSPKELDWNEQRSNRSGSRASQSDYKPEVEKLGRFELSTAPIMDANGKSLRSHTLSPPLTSSIGQSPNDIEKRISRPFEISDVTDISEIPGHSKKSKQKPSVETLERKMNIIVKRMEMFRKNLLDIQEVCKANHEMLQHFYNFTISNTVQQQNGDSFISQRLPDSLQQFDHQATGLQNNQSQLEIENARLKEQIEEMKMMLNSNNTVRNANPPIQSNPSNHIHPQGVGLISSNLPGSGHTNTSTQLPPKQIANVGRNPSLPSSNLTVHTGQSSQNQNQKSNSRASPQINSPKSNNSQNISAMGSGSIQNVVGSSNQTSPTPTISTVSSASSNVNTNSAAPTQTQSTISTTINTSARSITNSMTVSNTIQGNTAVHPKGSNPLPSPSTVGASTPITPIPNQSIGNRNSTDSRILKGSSSETLEQIVQEQLQRGPLKKNTLNDLRRSNSQQFQNSPSSQTNLPTS